ncbi:MAG: tetratricopeptide repeat protein [Chthoniobacteraceae bacterium]
MKRNSGFLLCVLLIFTGIPARAQTAPPQPSGLNITFKDGATTTAKALRRAGNDVMATVQVGTGVGEIGYSLGIIAKIDFPEPPQIKAAGGLLEQGKIVDALIQITPVVDYFSPFKDVPGNFWLQSAELKLRALIGLQRDQESTALLDEIVKAASDPEAVRFARVMLAASWARKGDHEKAIATYDEVINASTSQETLARAWLGKGDSMLALKDFDPALVAYLHVPVFYPGQKLLMPQALLGSARAYAGVDDPQDAEKTFDELLSQFPNSRETAIAKIELKKITSKPAAEHQPAAGNP